MCPGPNSGVVHHNPKNWQCEGKRRNLSNDRYHRRLCAVCPMRRATLTNVLQLSLDSRVRRFSSISIVYCLTGPGPSRARPIHGMALASSASVVSCDKAVCNYPALIERMASTRIFGEQRESHHRGFISGCCLVSGSLAHCTSSANHSCIPNCSCDP